MAAATHCISSCWGLSHKFKTLSLSNATIIAATTAFKPLSFFVNTSLSIFSDGVVTMNPLQRIPSHYSIVCEAAQNKKADSAAKRARQAEKIRVYNKAHNLGGVWFYG